MSVASDYAEIRVGDKIRFTPRGRELWPWTVRARDDRFIVATTQCPFKPKGTLLYTVVDLVGWQSKRYNGEGPGVVRSSLDTIGGGWGAGVYDDAECQEILVAVVSGDWDLSHRRVLSVRGIDVATAPKEQR